MKYEEHIEMNLLTEAQTDWLGSEPVFDNEKTIVFYRVFNGKRDYPSLMRYLSDESE